MKKQKRNLSLRSIAFSLIVAGSGLWGWHNIGTEYLSKPEVESCCVPNVSPSIPAPESQSIPDKLVISSKTQEVFKDAKFQMEAGQHASACRKYMKAYENLDLSSRPLIIMKLQNAKDLVDKRKWAIAANEFEKLYKTYINS